MSALQDTLSVHPPAAVPLYRAQGVHCPCPPLSAVMVVGQIAYCLVTLFGHVTGGHNKWSQTLTPLSWKERIEAGITL